MLKEGDVQALAFPADSFAIALKTFVFYSVPDPVRDFLELNWAVKPGERILLLEHVRVDRPVIGCLMNLLNTLIVGAYGANINSQTVESLKRAGLEIECIEHLGPMQMVKLIVA